MHPTQYPAAPELAVTRWFNTEDSPTLAGLRGEVVVIEAFQMLCPGCVSHGLPQAKRIQQIFGNDLTVLGLHTVFEHHDAMTPVSLEAFLHEYRIEFPTGVDAHEPGVTTPVTMSRYKLRGTPSLIVIDRAGRIRVNAFGQADDMAVGAVLARLIDEPRPEPEADGGLDIKGSAPNREWGATNLLVTTMQLCNYDLRLIQYQQCAEMYVEAPSGSADSRTGHRRIVGA